MTTLKRLYQILALGLLFVVLASLASAETGNFDEKRNKLIGYMLYKQLPSIHFSDKKVDDSLAHAAFDLYLKQLDFQKRFLLQEDVEDLKKYSQQIDDNLKSGDIKLPRLGYELLEKRIAQVAKIAEELVAGEFDFHGDESYESDPDKIDYAKNDEGLRQRWHKILKVQIITRYLDLVELEKEKDDKKSDEELWNEAEDKVASRNREFFTRLNQETLQDHYDRYFNAVARAFDPHSNYMAPASKEDFDIHMRGSLEGIGALLREEDGYIKVVRIIPGSASARQGRLAAEDVILQVAEGADEPVEVTDMRLKDAVRLIRGPKGTEVRLTVKKPDSRIVVIPIIRDVVQIEETFVKSTTLKSPDGSKIGYIVIPSFYRDFEMSRNGGIARNATDDTKRALHELANENISGLILDLRNNGGGSLVDAVEITGLFLESGPVVQVKNSFGTRKILNDEDDQIFYDGPMIVLVNLFSASASEILAAALQDYGRAVIVGGKHTHGKGTVQTILDMNENIPLLHLQRYSDLGALKVTIQKFYRITGGSTQYKGVIPDIELPSLYGHLKSGEKYLDNSLPWDHVEPVGYKPFSTVAIDLDLLREKSKDRVKKDEGLQIIEEEEERFKERSDKTEISLKLESMEKERQEANEARQKVGEHYKQYQEDQLDEFDGPTPEEDKEKSDNDWVEEVEKDPYVGESLQILTDISLQLQPVQ